MLSKFIFKLELKIIQNKANLFLPKNISMHFEEDYFLHIFTKIYLCYLIIFVRCQQIALNFKKSLTTEDKNKQTNLFLRVNNWREKGHQIWRLVGI